MPVGAIPFPFGMCRICKDKATGIHYGVATCEGCKGFFKRSITRGDKYKCFFGNDCDVTPKNRNRCKSCRFKRCLDVGMSVEAVRMGRIPKMDKEKALEAFHQGGSDYSKLELQVESTGVGTYDFKINTKADGEGLLTDHTDTSTCGGESGPILQSALTSPFRFGAHHEPSATIPCSMTQQKNDSVLNNAENFEHPSVTSSIDKLKQSSYSGEFAAHSGGKRHHTGCGETSRSCTITASAYNQSMECDKLNGEQSTSSICTKVEDELSTPCRFADSNPNSFVKSKVLNEEESDVAINTDNGTIFKSQDPSYSNFYHSRLSDDNHSECNPGPFAQPSYNDEEMYSVSNRSAQSKSNYMSVKEPEYGQTFDMRMNTPPSYHSNSVDNQNDIFDDSATDLRVQPAAGGDRVTKTETPDSYEQTQTPQCDNNTYDNAQEPFRNHCQRDIDCYESQTTNMFLPPPAHRHDVQFTTPGPGYYNQTSSNSSMTVGGTGSNRSGYSSQQRERDVNLLSPTTLSEPESHSIEAARCPTPAGSIISGEGSSSSAKSGFSPSVIQLLIDEVLNTCDGHSIKVRLAEKLQKKNVDKNLIFRMLYLIEQREKAKQLSDVDNLSGQNLSAIPESKKECMERFLQDLEEVKGYSSSDEMDKSLSNFDLKICNMVSNSLKHSPSKQTKYSPSKSNSGTESTGSNGNHCDSRTSDNNDRNKKVISQSDTVSSSSMENLALENTKKIKTTLVSMNLAQKILNRFKSEHREKIKLFIEGELNIKIMSDSDEDVKEVYNKLISGISGLNDRILGFCQHVPEFPSLSASDQEKLVKRSYYDLWTLSYAEYFRDGKSYWILPTGEIYSAPCMRKILNDEMVDTIFQFAEKFNALDLMDLEMGILGAVRLTATDGLELDDLPAVERIHNHLLNTLAYEVSQNHPDCHSRVLIDMFSLQPLLDAVNRIQQDIIANYSTKGFKDKAADTNENC